MPQVLRFIICWPLMHIYLRNARGREVTPRLRDLTCKMEPSDIKNARGRRSASSPSARRGSSRTAVGPDNDEMPPSKLLYHKYRNTNELSHEKSIHKNLSKLQQYNTINLIVPQNMHSYYCIICLYIWPMFKKACLSSIDGYRFSMRHHGIPHLSNSFFLFFADLNTLLKNYLILTLLLQTPNLTNIGLILWHKSKNKQKCMLQTKAVQNVIIIILFIFF